MYHLVYDYFGILHSNYFEALLRLNGCNVFAWNSHIYIEKLSVNQFCASQK